jgi:hypothetical protein
MRSRLAVVLSVLALSGLAACGDSKSDEPAADPTTTTAAEAKAQEVAVTYDGKKITAPEKIEAGLVRFNVASTADPEAQRNLLFTKLDAGKTAADVAAEVKTDKGAPPSWMKAIGSVQVAQGKTSSFTTVVDEGTWAVIAPPENDPGVFTVITVGPSMSGSIAATLPKTDAAVSATEYMYDIKGLKAGLNRITVKNTGGLPHIFAILGLKADAKLDEILAYEGEEEPQGLTDFQNNLSYMDPGKSGIVEVDIPAGRYAMVCFLDNAPGGKTDKPHFMLGMKQEFTIA